MQKQLLIAACLSVSLLLSGAAAAQDKPLTAQQQRMADCNKQAAAKNLAGDERKQFMSACLSGPKMTQQEKMTACNKQAGEKNLKGDERKKFMSQCLSG
jgi:psiF repeat.